jgi:hypothetical protein
VIAPSTYVQFPLDLRAVQLDPADEPPSHIVHLIADDARLITSVHTMPPPAGGR